MDTINAFIRDTGLRAKKLRRMGAVPCVMNIAGKDESISLHITASAANQLRRTKRLGSLVNVQVEGEDHPAVIIAIEYSRLTDEVIHICFQELEKGKKTSAAADVILLNRDKAQGVPELLVTRIPHSAEPEYLLDSVTVDLEGLPIGAVVTAGDLPEFQTEAVTLGLDPAETVLRMNDRKKPGVKLVGI